MLVRRRSQTSLSDCLTMFRPLKQMCSLAGKAWRWVGEMEELSKAFVDAGLPGGFHAGAADLYARMAQYKDVPPADAPNALEVTKALLMAGTKHKL